ncbi:MAG: nucleoside deaminase [Anaerolineae bacterium]|jgi:tRNA(adenine34) deaminase|nr:nucleoside deaminase [Anaerolineae bacterium]MBT7074658.1 nucleoside deaminase [Anaerolineae bacterium]MBT7782059.1 nucleoside deaminase [Anaerolineae bacterium]
MPSRITNKDKSYLRRAIELAEDARRAGNLPIGALIVLDGKIIARGKNSIWRPVYRPGQHAEIETLAAVPIELWDRASEMTLYTTLEPCLMCLGTVLVHRIGRVVFGSIDIHGGATSVFGKMPGAFEDLLHNSEWIGPALPDECDQLSKRVIAMALSHNPKKKVSTLWDLINPDFMDLNTNQKQEDK